MGSRKWAIVATLAAASLAGCAPLAYKSLSQYPPALIANDPSLMANDPIRLGCRSPGAHSAGVVALLNATKNRPYGVSHTVVKIENSVSPSTSREIHLSLFFSSWQTPVIACHATLLFTHQRTESGIYMVYPPVPQRIPPKPLRAEWISDKRPKADYQRGEAYYKGQSVPQSDTKAVDWWHKAAELRDGYWSRKADTAIEAENRAEAIKVRKESCGNPKVIADEFLQIPHILGLGNHNVHILHIHLLTDANFTIAGSVNGHKGLSGVLALTCPIRVTWSNGFTEDRYFSQWKNRYGQIRVAYSRSPLPNNRFIYPRPNGK